MEIGQYEMNSGERMIRRWKVKHKISYHHIYLEYIVLTLIT